jgi:hypothetical protein
MFDLQRLGILITLLVALTGCGDQGHEPQLPLLLGSINDLCTKLPSRWRDSTYQRVRNERVREVRTLIDAVRDSPQRLVTVRFTDADTGETRKVRWSLRQLAREQIREFDTAGYCHRGLATPRDVRVQALALVAQLRRAVELSG